MSDDDHVIFPLGMPEEIQQKLQRAHDQEHMKAEIFSHDVASFFDSLNVDQSTTLQSIMRNMAQASMDGGRAPAFFEGVLTGILHNKFEICLGCGENHDEVLAEKEAQAAQAVSAPEQPTSEEAPLVGQDREDMMVLYGLEKGDREGVNFQCKDCKIPYVSIEDRMLREPGPQGCPGCIHKAKWG